MLPPRLRPLQMRAVRRHRHAGIARRIRPRLVDVTVEDHAVHAFGEDAVALELHREWRRQPPSRTAVGIGRESLRAHDAPPPDMRRGRDGLRVAERLVAPAAFHVRTVRLPRQRGEIAVRIARTPELGHRHVALARELKVVERTVSIRLAVEDEPVLVAPRAETPRIVAGEQGRDHAPEIAEERLRARGAVDRIPGQHRKEIRDRITGRFRKAALESARPVLSEDLVAVQQHALQRPVFRESLQKPAHVGVEMHVERMRIELVAFEAKSRL